MLQHPVLNHEKDFNCYSFQIHISSLPKFVKPGYFEPFLTMHTQYFVTLEVPLKIDTIQLSD